jgi:hypothetical protein
MSGNPNHRQDGAELRAGQKRGWQDVYKTGILSITRGPRFIAWAFHQWPLASPTAVRRAIQRWLK